MSRVIAVAACGFILAACSMSMPSLDFFRSAPPTEVLRIESEPPGADARTAEGQSCRTPCELTVPVDGRGRDLVRAAGLSTRRPSMSAPKRPPPRAMPKPPADPHAAESGLCRTDALDAAAPEEEGAAQEEGRGQESGASRRSDGGDPAAAVQPKAAGPGQRLSVELSLAAAPAGAITRDRTTGVRLRGYAARGYGRSGRYPSESHMMRQRTPVARLSLCAGIPADRGKVGMTQAVSEFEVRRPLIDPFARAITYLRVSVTDRCDFRCVYCMSENMTFLPKADLLTLEELDRLCSAFVARGVRKLRLTGGEPLVRRGIMTLFGSLSRHLAAGDLDELTLTTNGSQLPKYAARAGRSRRQAHQRLARHARCRTSSAPSRAGASSTRCSPASTPRRPPACGSRSTPSRSRASTRTRSRR